MATAAWTAVAFTTTIAAATATTAATTSTLRFQFFRCGLAHFLDHALITHGLAGIGMVEVHLDLVANFSCTAHVARLCDMCRAEIGKS